MKTLLLILFPFALQADVTVAWEPSPSPDVALYRVELRSTASNANVLVTTEETKATLTTRSGVLYFLSITAISYAGLESRPYLPLSFQLP